MRPLTFNRSRQAGAQDVDEAGEALGLAPRGAGSMSTELLDESRTLSPRELEERGVIHRNESVREQADAFRELRTQLLAMGGAVNFVTMVAPITHGCGGSFVARNLATAFAFDDSKTAVLVDCDALRPSQHTALGVSANQGGLMDYLGSEAMDASGIMYGSGIPRLRLIPVGSLRESTGESFSSFRMRAMMDSLRSQYHDRYVVLDSPPALGSPDARILSELADFVVLVAGYGKVTPDMVQKAVSSFPPEKLAGVVMNQLP